MNYAFMSFSCPELALDGMLEAAARWGYAGVEPRLDSGHAHGIETSLSPTERRAVRARVADGPTTICCLAVSARYADPATCADYMESTRRGLELAADLGVPVLRVFGGHFPEDITRGQAIESLSAALSALAGQARACNVAICLETHDAWCDPRHVAQVMQNVNHDHVAVNWDVLHPVRTAGLGIRESLDILQPWIRHVHMHDAQLTPGRIAYAPMGTGAIDHRTVLQGLQAIMYTGYLSGEWIGYSPWQEHLPFEIARLREYEAGLGPAEDNGKTP